MFRPITGHRQVSPQKFCCKSFIQLLQTHHQFTTQRGWQTLKKKKFRTSKCSTSEDLYMQFYGISSIRLYKQSGRWQYVLVNLFTCASSRTTDRGANPLSSHPVNIPRGQGFTSISPIQFAVPKKIIMNRYTASITTGPLKNTSQRF